MPNVDTVRFTSMARSRGFKQALVTLFVAFCYVKTEGQTPYVTFEFRHCPTDLISDAMNVGTEVTITHCVNMCALRPWCAALIYRRQYPLCELFSKDGLSVLNTTGTAGYCQYVDENNFSAKFVQLRLECSTLANKTCPAQYVTCDLGRKQCIKPECPRLNVANGSLLGNMHNNGSRKQVTCHPDYIEVSRASITTCIDGNWIPEPHCVERNVTAVKGILAWQSSVWDPDGVNHVGTMAIDGNFQTTNDFCFASQRAFGNYLIVELAKMSKLVYVDILFRSDLSDLAVVRNSKITVLVAHSKADFDTNQATVCGHYDGPPVYPSHAGRVKCAPNTSGIYVKFLHKIDDWLNICEVSFYTYV